MPSAATRRRSPATHRGKSLDLRAPVRRRQRGGRRSHARRGAAADAVGADRARPPYRARHSRRPLRGGRVPHALQRRRARRPRALLSLSVGRVGAARALHDGVPGAGRRCGSAWRARAGARSRSTRTRAARQRTGAGPTSAGGSSPTASCCRAGRCRAVPAASSPAVTAAARTRRRSSAARPSRELLALREKLIAAPARVADAAVDLLGRERYDLVWLTFSAAHLAGHQFWDLSQLASEPSAEERALPRRRARGRLRGGRHGVRPRAGRTARRHGRDRRLGRRDGRQQLARRPAAGDARGGAARRPDPGGRGRRGRDLAPARGRSAAGARSDRAGDPRSRGARADGAPGAARHRLVDDRRRSATPPTTRATSA